MLWQPQKTNTTGVYLEVFPEAETEIRTWVQVVYSEVTPGSRNWGNRESEAGELFKGTRTRSWLWVTRA